MEKKEKRKLFFVYILVFLLAVYMDVKEGTLKEGNFIYRSDVGGDEIDVELLLDVKNVLEDYPVSIEVEPRQLTAEEAESYISEVIETIDEDFKTIDRIVPIKNFYKEGIVEAEWSFSPAGYIDTNGTIDVEKISEESILLTAKVRLTASAYEKVYCFPLCLKKPELSLRESLEKELDIWITQQQRLEGETIFQLPEKLGEYSVEWNEKKEYLSIKILLLEAISMVLLLFARKKENKALEEKKRRQRELEYPGLINQILILLEAGMTTRQAWRRIAYQYQEKCKQQLVEETEVYNAIMQMDRQLAEGEKERIAYENFMNQMELMCYRRLMRLLINNLEKGNKDICMQLSIEAKQAYEKRLLLAKKLGEEASTKMLIPMMIMMVLIMVIVIAPAIMGIQL